jgi:soluble lytic murein transglycosylase-like protein
VPTAAPRVADALDRAADSAGLPRDLVWALAYVESRYNPSAVSHVGAMGLLQLMPRTADGLGVDDPFDPHQNAEAGARYLARLIRKYDGDVRAALAAYNWGEGNVDRSGGDWPGSVRTYADNVLARTTISPQIAPDGAAWRLFLARFTRPYPWSLA